jgi:hypothetical protein
LAPNLKSPRRSTHDEEADSDGALRLNERLILFSRYEYRRATSLFNVSYKLSINFAPAEEEKSFFF